MARISTLALAATLTPALDTGIYNLPLKAALTNGVAANGDQITLATIQRPGRTQGCKLNVPATLGAGATVQVIVTRAGAQIATLTPASTAAAASVVSGASVANVNLQAGDLIELLVGGANIAAAATVEVDLHIQH